MKKFLLGAAAAGAALVGAAQVANAEEAKPTFSGNVALTSDYLFRGISQTDNGPAIQGGFDFGYGSFYAGTWASNVDFTEFGLTGDIEIDLYAGFKPTLGPVGLDIGVVGYFYPDADEKTPGYGEADYQEVYLKGSVPVTEKLSLGAALFYSPEFTLETGAALYYEANAGLVVTDALSLSAAVGYQEIDDLTGVLEAGISGEYTTWNIGATYSVAGFSFDLRYVDTDIDDSSEFVTTAYTTEARTEGKAILTVKRAL